MRVSKTKNLVSPVHFSSSQAAPHCKKNLFEAGDIFIWREQGSEKYLWHQDCIALFLVNELKTLFFLLQYNVYVSNRLYYPSLATARTRATTITKATAAATTATVLTTNSSRKNNNSSYHHQQAIASTMITATKTTATITTATIKTATITTTITATITTATTTTAITPTLTTLATIFP